MSKAHTHDSELLRDQRSALRKLPAIALTGALVAALLLTVACAGPPAAIVPDVLGFTLADAAETLVDAGLLVGAVTYDPAADGATWTVTAQSLTGEVAPGDIVDLVLSGTPPLAVPDVIGVDSVVARTRLEATGLSLAPPSETHHDTVPESLIVTQTPAAGSLAPAGSAISVTVSLGPETPPSSTLRLEQIDTVSGPYSPKSVVADQVGHVFAQNMMYRHTIAVFDAETRELVTSIPDAVTLADFGYPEYSGTVKGGPVEAAVTPDGAYMYVSNYSMYGPGFSHPGDDEGGPGSGVDPSFVYRIPTDTLKIDQVIKVGSVPKFLAVTPDGRHVLVSNWITYDVSVIEVATGTVVETVYVGRKPRGIAIDADSSTAYVAVMGSYNVARIDLVDYSVDFMRVGASPRHVIISPGDEYLYVTLNGEDRVAKVDLSTGEVLAKVATGDAPRSMTMAPDGESLYVVNYEDDSVSKVLTAGMEVVQTLPVSHHPIGITYVDDLQQVWVSCYVGTFHVFQDR